MAEIIDVLEATEVEWAEHLSKMPNRFVRCFGKAWGVVDGEPVGRIVWALTDAEYFDGIISMIHTPEPNATIPFEEEGVPGATYELVRPATAQFVHNRCLELEEKNQQPLINYRSWFKALVILNATTPTQMSRLRTRLAQVANGHPTMPG